MRPNPIQWTYYAFGGTLPAKHRDWVRRDLTGDGAVVRHLVRGMVPFLPIFAAGFLLPGPLALRGAVVLLGMLLALFFSAAYMEPNRKRRLERHGLPGDLQNPRVAERIEAQREGYLRAHRPLPDRPLADPRTQTRVIP